MLGLICTLKTEKEVKKKAEKKVKTVIRVFQDNTAEILEGKSLENFLAQEQAALSLLLTRSWANPKKDEIEWLPVKEVKITR